MRITIATISAWFVGFLVLLRTCQPLNRSRSILLVAVAAAFVAVVVVFGRYFELVPLIGGDWAALAALGAAGAAIVMGTASLIRRKKWDA